MKTRPDVIERTFERTTLGKWIPAFAGMTMRDIGCEASPW